MNALSLEVEGVAGTNIEECLRDAVLLARLLRLHHVTFSANERRYTVYANGKALEMSPDRLTRNWDQSGGFTDASPSREITTLNRT